MSGLRVHDILLHKIEVVAHELLLVSRTESQSAICCSLKDDRLLVAIDQASSREPVIENAQYDPHCLWFYTGVIAPFLDPVPSIHK